MADKHYVSGSGMFGCLYDSGPHITDTKEQAILGLLDLFSDLSESELQAMNVNLTCHGSHTFDDPIEAGAQYCEISEQPGPAPEES